MQKKLDTASDLWYNGRGFAAATQFVAPLRGRHHFSTSLSHFGAGDLLLSYHFRTLALGEAHRIITLALWRRDCACRCAGRVVCWCSNTVRSFDNDNHSHLENVAQLSLFLSGFFQKIANSKYIVPEKTYNSPNVNENHSHFGAISLSDTSL